MAGLQIPRQQRWSRWLSTAPAKKTHRTILKTCSAISVCIAIGFTTSFAPTRAQTAPAALNLNDFKMTFDDEFTQLDISAHGPGTTWTAHTPWHGDFGDASFDDPGKNGPFSITPAGLAITARKDMSGHWHSGLICSVNIDGPGQIGFRQKYGYFEIDAQLPPGPGTWPAFWLIGTDKTRSASEIDIFEYYGQFNQYFHATEHLWVKGKDNMANTHLSKVPAGSLVNHFNTYGVLIGPKEMIFYLNRKPFWSTPTPSAYQQPMYILANLALGGGWPINHLQSPAIMQIRYIRAYQFKKIPAS
jgi:hypothetical protein